MENPTPFDLVYRQLVSNLLEQPRIAEVLKAKNLIQYDKPANAGKAAIQTADLPEIVVYCEGVRGNLHQSTSTALLTTSWRVVISTGMYDSKKLNSLVFGVICCLVNKEQLMALKWKNRTFVKDIRLATGDFGLSDPAKNRNIAGWSSLLAVEIDFSLLLQDLKEN